MTGAACVYLFETTHQAMWAEDVSRERGILAEVVAAPPDARAKCGLALTTREPHCAALAAAMTEVGVEFRVYDG